MPYWMGTCTRSEPKCPIHGMVFWNKGRILCSYMYVQKLRHAPYAPYAVQRDVVVDGADVVAKPLNEFISLTKPPGKLKLTKLQKNCLKTAVLYEFLVGFVLFCLKALHH